MLTPRAAWIFNAMMSCLANLLFWGFLAWGLHVVERPPADDVTRWIDTMPASCQGPLNDEPTDHNDPARIRWRAALPRVCVDWLDAFPLKDGDGQ